jgi:broad specificity phosphatase PhoE
MRILSSTELVVDCIQHSCPAELPDCLPSYSCFLHLYHKSVSSQSHKLARNKASRTVTKISMTAVTLSVSSNHAATLSRVKPVAKVKRTFDIFPYGTKEEDIMKSSNYYSHTKVVHFIRHAQGTHNVKEAYNDVENIDARLTEQGQEECRSMAESIRQAAQESSSTAAANLAELHESAQLVVTSPLTRCIQTSLSSFPMLAERNVPFVAHSGVRETVNFNCDRRRNIQDITKDFGDGVVDFTHVPTDHDDVWEAYEKRLGTPEKSWENIRESGELHVAAERGRQFMEWLQTRPERNVVVCTHSAFLRCFWNFGVKGKDVPMQPPQILDDREKATNVPVVRYCGEDASFAESFRSSFENCELRSLVIAFPKD